MKDRSLAWVATALFVALYLTYSSTFSFDYLVNDEVSRIGQSWDLLRHMRVSFLLLGRGLFGAYEALVYGLAGYDSDTVQLIRFLNFLSMAGICLVLFFFLQRLSRSSFLAFFSVLLFCSQPAVQVSMGYSLQLISNTQPAMWLSLLAFYLHFHLFPRILQRTWPGHLLLFLIFTLALQSTQNYAFFAVVPLSFALLIDWERYQQRVVSFFLVALLAFLSAVLIYKMGLDYLHGRDLGGYKLAEQSLAAAQTQPLDILLKALNPVSYWSGFKLWNYPFPFHTTLPLAEGEKQIAISLLVIWLLLVGTTFVAEYRNTTGRQRISVIQKWLSAVACLAFGALFMIADSPLAVIEHRPHLTMVLVGVVIFMAAYSLKSLGSLMYRGRPPRLATPLIALLVLLNLAGAQQGVSRNMVDLRGDQLDFIYTELAKKPAGKYDEIIVVLPAWRKCISEPCGPWLGPVVGMETHEVEIARYHYALENLGIPAESKTISFVKKMPQPPGRKQLVIDWRKYTTARKLRLEHEQTKGKPANNTKALQPY